MNTKENQRTRLSKIMLKNALTDLLNTPKSIDKITVREICEKADLNRSTFYAHYNSPEDLLKEIENELIISTEEHLIKIGAENNMGAHKYILSFLRFIKENDSIFRTLLINASDPEFKNRFMQQSIIQFVDNLNIHFPKAIEQYIYSYILNGSTGIIIQWIRSDYAANENDIVNLLFEINNGAIVNLAL